MIVNTNAHFAANGFDLHGSVPEGGKASPSGIQWAGEERGRRRQEAGARFVLLTITIDPMRPTEYSSTRNPKSRYSANRVFSAIREALTAFSNQFEAEHIAAGFHPGLGNQCESVELNPSHSSKHGGPFSPRCHLPT
jgi:hypothetical protein